MSAGLDRGIASKPVHAPEVGGRLWLGGYTPRLSLGPADGMALLAVAAWGLNYSISKQVLEGIAPLSGAFLRGLICAVLFAAVLLVARRWQLPRRADVPRLLGVGLIGMTLNAVLYTEGLYRTSATHAGLIPALTPLVVFGLSHWQGSLRLGPRELVGLGLGLGGAVLIVGTPLLAGTDSGSATLVGDLLSAGSAIVWGLWMLAAMPLLRRYGTLVCTTWLTILSTVGLLPGALPGLLTMQWETLTLPLLGGLAYWALVAGAIGGLLWYTAAGRIGAARTMIYANLQSFFAVLFAALLLGEVVEATALAGGLAVAIGVLLTRRASSEQTT